MGGVSLRFPVAPMKAALGTLPHDDDRWAYEIKFDGFRTLAFVDGGTLRLQSSNLIDVTGKYPELGALPGDVHARSAIVDGELVVLDDEGRPRFELIQRHERQAAFYAFDLLQLDGTDTIALPYEERRRLLAEIVEPGSNWAVPGHRVGGGTELLAATAERGLEGVMAKRLGSAYLPGKRAPSWRKVKNRRRVHLVIGGYTASENRAFGALLVGEWDGARLVFRGGVGTGFTQRTLDELGATMRSLRRESCPFDPNPPASYRTDAVWIEPSLVADVELAELTNDGFVRHASYLGLV
jgi:bifunctional non-homologous end joining protein LigD